MQGPYINPTGRPQTPLQPTALSWEFQWTILKLQWETDKVKNHYLGNYIEVLIMQYYQAKIASKALITLT
jgi:hypothetical protein